MDFIEKEKCADFIVHWDGFESDNSLCCQITGKLLNIIIKMREVFLEGTKKIKLIVLKIF